MTPSRAERRLDRVATPRRRIRAIAPAHSKPACEVVERLLLETFISAKNSKPDELVWVLQRIVCFTLSIVEELEKSRHPRWKTSVQAMIRKPIKIGQRSHPVLVKRTGLSVKHLGFAAKESQALHRQRSYRTLCGPTNCEAT